MLSGKRILITGANGGIGYAISELLLKNNAKLDLIYHKNKQNIERLIRDNPDKLQDISIHQVDLTNDEELKDVLTTITSTNPADIFIHSPTYPTPHKSIMNMEWSEFQKHIELQSKAFFQITKSLFPNMKKQKMGRVISILTSYVVNEPPSGLSDYVVAKYSLLIDLILLISCNFENAAVFSYTFHLLVSAESTQNFDFVDASFCAIMFSEAKLAVLTETSLLNLPTHVSISSTGSVVINVIFSKLIDLTLKNAPIAALAV